jgi:hypothetical protein
MSTTTNKLPETVPDDPPATGRTCALCGGDDMRVKFPASERPITYCIDCMVGSASCCAAVDMHIFESCIIQNERKKGR